MLNAIMRYKRTTFDVGGPNYWQLVTLIDACSCFDEVTQSCVQVFWLI